MPDPESHDAETDSPAIARNSTVDSVVALAIFVFGVVFVWQAWKLGSRWTSEGPGAGYFPFYIGLILCISALGIFYQARLGKSPDHGVFVDRLQLRRVASVFLPAVVYVLAIYFLGLYVASAIYIVLFMVILGKYGLLKSVLVGVIFNAIFFAMFEVWFKVPLYKGVLDPLRFLGY